MFVSKVLKVPNNVIRSINYMSLNSSCVLVTPEGF